MHITKINEVYLHIKVDQGVARELSDFFTFEVPGAKFMPQYRSRMWDGKIRLFSIMTGEIYVGLLSYIEEFAKRNEIEPTYGEGVKDGATTKPDDIRKFIQRVRPRSRGLDIQVRDYQFDAIQHAIGTHRSLLVSPTASGKSLIIYLLSVWYTLLLDDKKVLILVPTTSLVEQMYGDFVDYGFSEEHLQKIYQGYTKDIDKTIVISTWQSVYKQQKKWFDQFGAVFGDEAHLFKAKSLTGIMTKLVNCKYRHGLTGTLDGTQTHQLVLEGVFGKANKVVSTKELMDSNTVAQLNVKCIVLDYPDADKKYMKNLNYQEEVDLIVKDTRRNNFIINLTSHLKGNTLVLFQFVEKHGLELFADMEKTLTNRKVFNIYGGTDTKYREDVRNITEKESDAVIVASYGTFSTGINIRNLHNIVFASPSKSRIRVLQSIGRTLRLGDNKDSATVYDIADDFSYKGKQNFTLRHFQERINIYNQEEFDYQIDKVNIK